MSVIRSLVLLVLALAVHTASAQEARSIEIEDFSADIRVLESGVTEVTETLQIDFRGSWEGLIRDIALNHETAQGRRVRLDLEVLGVTDGQGDPLRYETTRRGRVQEVRFWVPDAEDAIRTAVIRYRLGNALRFFGDVEPEADPVADAGPPEGAWDELYWNVTGNDWEMPIRNASARVTLPGGAQDVQAWGYTGRAGSNAQDATVAVDGSVVEVRANRGFAPGEGLTVSVVWAPGLVDRTTAMSGPVQRVADWWPLSLPVVAFGLMFPLWRRKGREPRRRSVAVQYEPPEGMSPAELGTLVDHKAEMHDITATLVDLAVRGYLVIEEKQEKALLGLRTTKEFYFHPQKPRAEWDALEEHEKRYLQALFAPKLDTQASVGEALTLMREMRQAAREAKAEGRKFDAKAFMSERQAAALAVADQPEATTVKLSDLTNRFYTHLEGIRSAIYARLIERGFYARRPDKVSGKYAFAAFSIVVVGFFAFAMAADGVGMATPVAVAAGFGLSAVIVGGFGKAMRARTPEGVRTLERALGFKEFLERVESDRYRRMITSPELFERFLPHAMAFRVERRWAAAFEDLYTTPPSWYVGSSAGHFSASSFTRDLGSMSRSASSTMSSSPSSSGSGGGGSSGGGSGGGGGRGF